MFAEPFRGMDRSKLRVSSFALALSVTVGCGVEWVDVEGSAVDSSLFVPNGSTGGEQNAGGNDNDSALDCPVDEQAEWSRSGYHDFLQANCGLCHLFGEPATGAFADPDLSVAYSEYSLRPEQVVEFSLSATHKPPFTGPHLQPELDAILDDWEAVLGRVAACEAAEAENTNDTESPGEEPREIVTDPLLATVVEFTAPLAMNATEEGVTLSWELASALTSVTTPASLTDVVFELTVRTVETATGQRAYLFSSPTFSTGPQALSFGRIEVRVNAARPSSATTFHSLAIAVPSTSTMTATTSAMPVPFDFSASDTLEVGFGFINAIDDFDPTEPPPVGGGDDPVGGGADPVPGVTFATLSTGDGVFALECVSCHSAANPAGGLDLTSYMSTLMTVTPNDPDASTLVQRMEDPMNPMPPAGLLPQAMIDSVREWIASGAPEG